MYEGKELEERTTTPAASVDRYLPDDRAAQPAAAPEAVRAALEVVAAHTQPIGEDVMYARGWDACQESIMRELIARIREGER